MTDNEITKELQSASEWFNRHGRNTNTAIIGICDRAVDLINRKNAEIERLKAENDKLAEDWSNLTIEKDQLFEEAKALIEKAKAEAIKEFAERLEDEAYGNDLYDRSGFPVKAATIADVENVKKEMTAEVK